MAHFKKLSIQTVMVGYATNNTGKTMTTYNISSNLQTNLPTRASGVLADISSTETFYSSGICTTSEVDRPLPKALPRKERKRDKKKGKSAKYTEKRISDQQPKSTDSCKKNGNLMQKRR